MRILGVLMAAALLVLTPAAASAAIPDVPGREITRWDQTYTLQPDGTADVRLEFDFDFGDDPGHGPYLSLATRQGYDKTYDRLYAMSNFSASSPTGAPSQMRLDKGRDYVSIWIGDANNGSVSGVQTYVLTYSVDSVMNSTDASETATGIAGDEFYWNAIGDGWVIPISHAKVTVVAPVAPTDIQCFAGRKFSTTPCDAQSAPGATTTFSQTYLEPGQPFTVDLLYPAGNFETKPALIYRSDFRRAFTLNAGTIGAAAVVLLIGLGLLVWKLSTTAVDEQFAGAPPGPKTPDPWEGGHH